jgi:serine/threonine-protein kinase
MIADDDFGSTPYPTIPSGTKIGNRYLIQTILGKGGLGRTYLAFDTYRFNEPCVLKEFAPIVTEVYQVEKSRDLFKREAQILYQLKHPQIPQFYASFATENRLFLVQQYVQGKSYYQLLQQRLRQGQTFSEQEILAWLLALLPVLEYIHNCGIVHRDISPDNIIQMYGEKLPVLIDFGVGKQSIISEESNRVTDVVTKRTFVGKVGYAPEEQMNWGRCYPCSDLYSLGVTAIVLLTGKQPNVLLDSYSLEWQWHSYTNIGNNFGKILDQLLIRNPKYRYQSATEVILALQSISEDSSINHHQKVTFAQPITDSREINASPSSQTQKQTINRSYFNPNAELIKYYEKQLAYYIGPIASLIIEESLATNSLHSYQEFVEVLIEYIPEPNKQLLFKRSLL